MQAAPLRQPEERTEDAALWAVPHSDAALALAREVIAGARQDYLDAVPIAAAVLYLADDGATRVSVANSRLRQLVPDEDCAPGESIDQLAFFIESGIGDAVRQFLPGDGQYHDFDGNDGHALGGRFFAVRLGRLKPDKSAERRCLLSLIDKTAEVETERSLRSAMLHDSLTGLPNRLSFNERIEALLGDPGFVPGSHAVLVLDMTRFSRVNECVGAIAGDELLITFARRLVSALRSGDLLARTGGDEFGILARLDRGLDDAVEIAARIKGALARPFRLSELEIRVDCAIGCAIPSGAEALAEEVLRNAQFAMKRAKCSGQFQIYEPNQAKAARRRFSIETELRRAIEGGKLTLAFQPLVALPTGRISGFEALARWNHDERGEISPSEFIPVAEESGLIVALGRWALNSALDALRDWDVQAGAPLPVSMSVNLSAIQIARDDVAEAAAGALRASGIAGKRLTIELTESAIVQDPVRATQALEALKGLNARVAMDDFGTGYTSLAYLQRLPIDILKIDRSFVTGMVGNRDSTAIVRAVLSLATALGMETTAEGIDTAALASALADLGCSHGQGYYFSPPLSAKDALDYWLARDA